MQNLMEKYAELAVRIGANVQKDQVVLLKSPIMAVDLARLITKKAYEAGAKDVIVDYNDQEITKERLLHANDDVLENFPKWRVDGMMTYLREGACIINIDSSNPDLMKDVDSSRMKVFATNAAKASVEYKKQVLGGETAWTIVAYPNIHWAKKMFPELSDDAAMEALWKNIFKATRTDTPDPVDAWKEHLDNLDKRVKFLNEKQFVKLHYTSSGTDLHVELPEGHLWVGGGQVSTKGETFLPNLPTEEVFTLPKKNGVNGTLQSTKPLNYQSTLIDNFTMTFKEGRIVDFTAETGYDSLKNLIETDEGSHFLGEVALVPHHSPISNTNLTFFNTLYDENASCHFAVGSAYLLCVENSETLTDADKERIGVNDSLTHVDFMVGSEQLDIVGTTKDGETVQIFTKGNWAF